MSYPRAVPFGGGTRRSAHRFRLLSIGPRRQVSLNEAATSFGLGTSATHRFATLRRTSTVVDTSDRCLLPKLSNDEHPYSLVPGASTRLAPRAERWALGLTAWPGERAFTCPFSASADRIRLCSRLATAARGCCPRRGRCDRPLTSVSLLSLRFSLDLLSRLRVGPPGREPPRLGPPPPCDRQ